jgi:transcriptional regulator GlxA family with amidase domain
MLFEAEGVTFLAFVTEARLARAYDLLGDPAQLNSKISAIARQCGFHDLSWFNRGFSAALRRDAVGYSRGRAETAPLRNYDGPSRSTVSANTQSGAA